jgi:hypothetical protein
MKHKIKTGGLNTKAGANELIRAVQYAHTISASRGNKQVQLVRNKDGNLVPARKRRTPEL